MSYVLALQYECREARALLRQMLDIHGPKYDALNEMGVSAEEVNRLHELDEEALCADIEAFFEANP